MFTELVISDAAETMSDLNAMAVQTSPEVVFDLLGSLASFGSVEL